MSKSNKEKQRQHLIRNIRNGNIQSIPKNAYKIKIKFINDELLDYICAKKGVFDIETKPLFKIRNNFDYIRSQVIPIIEKYKFDIAYYAAKELNIFDINISVWVSEEGLDDDKNEMYSLSFYLDTKKKSERKHTIHNMYGKIEFLTIDNFENLKEHSQRFENYVFPINNINKELNKLISENSERIFISFSEYKDFTIHNKLNKIEIFENKLNIFINYLKKEFNYSVFNDDLYFISREYYIGNESYWSIIPEHKSNFTLQKQNSNISEFRKIDDVSDLDFINAMLESKVLNIHNENIEELSIKEIIELSVLFGY